MWLISTFNLLFSLTVFAVENKIFDCSLPKEFVCIKANKYINCRYQKASMQCNIDIKVIDLENYSLQDHDLILRNIGLNLYEKYQKKPHFTYLKDSGFTKGFSYEYFDKVKINLNDAIVQSFIFDIFGLTNNRRHIQVINTIWKKYNFRILTDCEAKTFKTNIELFLKLSQAISFEDNSKIRISYNKTNNEKNKIVRFLKQFEKM
jgi:hypothetical protein